MRIPRNLSMRLGSVIAGLVFLVKLRDDSCFCVEMFITGELTCRILLYVVLYSWSQTG